MSRSDLPAQNLDLDASNQRRNLSTFLTREAARCTKRRKQLFGASDRPTACHDDEPVRHDHYSDGAWSSAPGNWGLALSGGGIRSATFCLGALQALAKPSEVAQAGLPPHCKAALESAPGLLQQFDYMSSVSGGGFTAGFVQSLFVSEPGKGTQASVNAHLAEEPPGRVRGGSKPSPLAWLRENGRYLAPSGAGDLLYAIGLSVRNWLGIQCVIGGALMWIASVLAILAATIGACICDNVRSWWGLPLAVLCVWVIPVTGAYWITRDIGALKGKRPLPVWRLSAVVLVGSVLLLIGAWPAWPLRLDAGLACSDLAGMTCKKLAHEACGSLTAIHLPRWAYYCLVSGLVLLATAIWAIGIRTRSREADTPAGLAVAMTKCFTTGLLIVVGLGLLTFVIVMARLLLDWQYDYAMLASAATGGGLAIMFRRIMKVLPAFRGAWSTTGKTLHRRWRSSQLPLLALAFLLALGMAIFWTAVAYWIMMPPPEEGPVHHHYSDEPAPFPNALALFLLCSLFLATVAKWPSILNMSGYHFFYSSRLTRAYLGAANPSRTTAGGAHAAAERMSSTTEPDKDDGVRYEDYHANLAAPLHLINITLNQTLEPAEQLVQRDRKGLPFVVLPCLDPHGETDARGKARLNYSFGDRFNQADGKSAELSIGDWLAISGAAVSTGLGRQTSFGASVCVTFANARIGRWWPARVATDEGLRSLMPTYAYLWDELVGRFHGHHREYLYLTDGGHFENTATYELLRRVAHDDTAVRFIVLCDCGADAAYRYDDLANLVRLARIDFGLEVEVDHAVAQEPGKLASVFGVPETMGPPDLDDLTKLDNRCAMLLNVRRDGRILARIILVKPRLIRCASSDLLSYAKNNPKFPHQSTGDQFFDEEQWESYRKLGLECCRAVLALGEPLWQTVLATDREEATRRA